MADISQIFFASSRLTIDRRSPENDLLPLFKENEIIEAKVVKLFSGRSAQLLVSGRTVTVKTHVPLSEGETILLRADPSGEGSVLKLVSRESSVQQLNKALADNMDRAGPYRNLLKLFDVIHRETKITGALPDTKGEKETVLPERAAKLLTSRSEEILGRMPPSERRLIENFVNVRSLSFQDKLSALFHSPEGKKFFEENRSLHGFAKEGPEKMIALFTDGKKHRAEEISALPGSGREPVMEKRAGPLLGTIADRPGKLSLEAAVPEEKGAEALLQESRIKWADKVVTLLSANSELLIDRETFHGDIKTFIETLLQRPDPLEKKTAPLPPQESLLLESQERSSPVLLKGSLGVSLRMMSEIVREMALKSDAPDSQMVERFIKNSGLSWENKLLNLADSETGALPKRAAVEMMESDLKGLALSTLSLAHEKPDEALSLVKGFLESLEELQLINRYSGEATGRYLVPFPVMWHEQIRFGQLLIDLGKETDKGKPLKERVIKVQLLLELSNLGDVRADFSIYKKAVTGLFGVGDPQVGAMVKKELPGLEKRLTALGYKVYGIDCEVVSPELLSTTTLTDQLIDHDANRVLNLLI